MQDKWADYGCYREFEDYRNKELVYYDSNVFKFKLMHSFVVDYKPFIPKNCYLNILHLILTNNIDEDFEYDYAISRNFFNYALTGYFSDTDEDEDEDEDEDNE